MREGRDESCGGKHIEACRDQSHCQVAVVSKMTFHRAMPHQCSACRDVVDQPSDWACSKAEVLWPPPLAIHLLSCLWHEWGQIAKRALASVVHSDPQYFLRGALALIDYNQRFPSKALLEAQRAQLVKSAMLLQAQCSRVQTNAVAYLKR